MATDVFPHTQKTWIEHELERGPDGQLSVNRHLMEAYAWPLTVYYLGTNMRWLGEPDEVVNGFFASRLAMDGFMGKWQVREMRLRRWIINAFNFYLMEIRRQRRRLAPAVGDQAEEQLTYSGNPAIEVDRAAVVGFVQAALEDSRRTCTQLGLDVHWDAFTQHHLEGRAFNEIASDLGVSEARVTVMARTARRKFKLSMKDVLIRDGVSEDELNGEIHSLLRAIGS